MPASKIKQEYVKNELKYKLLFEIYKNSRLSLRDLAKASGVSHHVVKSILKKLEEEYKIVYTLELDEEKLGFAKGKLITIKFGIKPELEEIKSIFLNDVFVQDLYLAEGDFDLLIYVSGLSEEEFKVWQWIIRMKLGKYKPLFRLSTVSKNYIGFMPLKNKAISIAPNLTEFEKKVLMLLNENSRAKISEIAAKTKTKDLSKIIYVIKKMTSLGVIKRFTALTQKPGKSVVSAYGCILSPLENHKEYSYKFFNEVINEKQGQVISDYNYVVDTVGYFDVFYICAFEKGEELNQRGPEMFRKIFADEQPIVEKTMLTDVLIGLWPFHLDNFEEWKETFK
jgi:DNA-binding Lrp family transcriptional regulator